MASSFQVRNWEGALSLNIFTNTPLDRKNLPILNIKVDRIVDVIKLFIVRHHKPANKWRGAAP